MRFFLFFCVTSELAKCKSHVAEQNWKSLLWAQQCDSNRDEHGDRREHGHIRNLAEYV